MKLKLKVPLNDVDVFILSCCGSHFKSNHPGNQSAVLFSFPYSGNENVCETFFKWRAAVRRAEGGLEWGREA